jgi:ABC-type glycerol-3-phosphate transport system substrate-binding protein
MSSRKIIQFLIIILSLVIIAEGVIYFDNYRSLKNGTRLAEPAEVTLEFWGLWDNSDSWQEIIRRFESETHIWNGKEIKVKIVYTKQDITEYEEKIEQGYKENNSPSIFMINNYHLEDYADKLEPLSGNFALVKEYELLDYSELADIFPLYTLQDAEHGNNEMFALPIYSDSLALYYNKDLFAKAGIATPPTTWDELKKDLKKLALADRKNNIKQAGIALGTGKNINRSCDIVSLLMLQGGSKIINNQKEIDINKKIAFNTPQGIQEREPGLTAIQFYMEFSDPNKEIYTWNDTMENSVKSFAEGKTAMMFGYSYQKANLLAMNPDLNYGIAPAPQIPNSTVMNISNVWSPVVSNQQSCSTTNQNDKDSIDCAQIAWSFLSFANKKENIIEYLNKTGKASARIDIAKEQSQKNDTTSAFAKQADSARSYNKFDDKIETILTTMLDEIYKDRDNWKNKVDNAVAQIEDLKK